MENPFRYGETVTGKYFTNRKKEIRDIKNTIKSAQNMFIYSSRRMGKTSLLKTVIELLKKDHSIVPVYVDLQRAASAGQFVEIYSAAISRAFITKEAKIKKAGSFFKRIVPSFEIAEDGKLRFSFDFSKTSKGVEKAIEEVYEIPQKIAVKYKKRVVVVFDEFQEISQYDGAAFEKKLRSFIQHHDKVCYIFMGSKTHIILDMFKNPHRAFYQSAKIYPLFAIPQKDLEKFIIERFKSTGRQITKELACKIVRMVRQSPYHLQQLCSTIWLAGKNKIKEVDMQTALDNIMRTQNELFYSWYDSVSMHQRAVLGALPQERGIFSNDVRLKYNLGSSSTVQASVGALVKKNFIVKDGNQYRLFDPFFEMWLIKNISG
ncbi:MAG: ATP-binding protein [Elusimicrobiota bacterium]|nr:ATP-binding protein [Elusimicrobiota bacterium]